MKEKLNHITRIPYLTNFMNSLKNCKKHSQHFITFQIIMSYPQDHQSFLENKADFLLDASI